MGSPILVIGVVPTNVYRFCVGRGLDHERVMGNLEVPWSPTDKRAPMPYRDVVTIFERLAELNELAAFADFYVNRIPIVAMVASHAITTTGLYRLAAFTWTKIWPWRVVVAKDADVLNIEVTIDDQAGPSLPMLDLVEHVLRRLPTGFRRPPRGVEVVGKTPMGAFFDVCLDPEAHVSEPPAEMIFEELHTALGSIQRGSRIPDEWGLTKAEARVVQVLAGGNNAKAVARQLGVSHETVRTLLKRAMWKARVGSQLELVTKLRS